MFSCKEKKIIAAVVEQTLFSLNHPEMPKEKLEFSLHVKGKDTWSWADIEPNWKHEVDCPICRGGKDKVMLLTNPPQEKKCSNCNGTGKVPKNTNPNPWNEVARDVLEENDG